MFTTEIYNEPGDFTWLCPIGVFSIDVECYGAGGGGGGIFSTTGYFGGGGGGGYSKGKITVTPGNIYNYTVGNQGAGIPGPGYDGGDTSFNINNVIAGGGKGSNSNIGGIGGIGSGSLAIITHTGGNGADGNFPNGGGGGSSAGPLTNGNTGVERIGGLSVSFYSGSGGAGGIATVDPVVGVNYGGGGGGAASNIIVDKSGANGGDGLLLITYEQTNGYFNILTSL